VLGLLHDRAVARPRELMPLPEMSLAVYGTPDGHAASTLRGHIYQLRGKIEVEPDRPQVLLSQRRRGYRLVLAPAPAGRGAGDGH
jgi:DNA-binding response OmpR family regulator